MQNQKIIFNDGHSIPQLGFGLYLVNDGATDVVLDAFKAGYRSIDGAQIYKNESALGEAIKKSGLKPQELFITTKIWNDEQGRDKTLKSFDLSMEKLGLEQLDLLLIHWPSAHRNLYVETWKTLIEIKRSGRVKSIGVSNFHEDHLKKIIDSTSTVPAVNQIELHPHFQQKNLVKFQEGLGIKTECWSPLGQGHVIKDPIIMKIAQKHHKSPAQIIIRWHIDMGFIVIPKSVTPSRIKENFDVFNFSLSPDDMGAIERLDNVNGRVGPDPSTAAF
jgi:2,5-diketo-D-gluconate reductase A